MADIEVGIEGNLLSVLIALDVALSAEALGVWLNEDANEYLTKRANARFNNSGDDASGQWPGLSPYTITDREAKGFSPGPPEVRSGELQKYITSGGRLTADSAALSELTFPGEAPGNAEMLMKLSVAQTGAVAHNGAAATPARPVLAIGNQDVEDLLLSLSFSIVDEVQAAF